MFRRFLLYTQVITDSTVQVSFGAATAEERDRLIEMGVTVLQVAPGM